MIKNLIIYSILKSNTTKYKKQPLRPTKRVQKEIRLTSLSKNENK